MGGQLRACELGKVRADENELRADGLALAVPRIRFIDGHRSSLDRVDAKR